jgi:hypothetical protein
MLAGSAIDAMLKEKGLVTGSVYARIEQAVTDGILTKDMSEWAHAVRLEANSPRHADLDDPHATPLRAQQVVDFATSLGIFFLFFRLAFVAAWTLLGLKTHDLWPPICGSTLGRMPTLKG